ncbi:MAG: hypothetical protein JWM27_4501 [Gemmatimonadetes bacterium]|nr:hypothetical protein [Gemmatimonadota bacterium]
MPTIRLARLAALSFAVLAAGRLAAQVVPAALPVEPRVSLAALVAADSVNGAATAAYRDKRWGEAAAGWSAAAATPKVPFAGTAHYNAACAYALGGEVDPAFEHLRAALASGWHDSALLASDTDLQALRADSRWAALLADTRAADAAYGREHSDPERARLVTSDIDLFWRAYDHARATADSAARVAIWRDEYVQRASDGYLDYFLGKVHTVESFSRFVSRNEAYYDGIRGSTAGVAAMAPRMRQAFRRMKELYPAAFFPDVYFGIGRLTSGGTVSQRGLLIGTEMYAVAPGTDTTGLPDYAKRIVAPIDALPHTVAHELVHFEQNTGGSHTLLKGVLVEGGADFIAELLLPGGAEPEYRTWGRAHEREVWNRFREEMHNPTDGLWIGSAGQRIAEWGGWPGDLGYFVGYQITKAYYDRAADKQKAIADLLRLDDPEAILRASRYEDRFIPRPPVIAPMPSPRG